MMLLGKSFQVQQHSKTQSSEESSSTGRFNPVGCLQQSGCLGKMLKLLKCPVEELSSPECVFEHSGIQKDFPNNSWKLRNPKSQFDHGMILQSIELIYFLVFVMHQWMLCWLRQGHLDCTSCWPCANVFTAEICNYAR